MEMNCQAVVKAVKGKMIAAGSANSPINRFVIDSRQAGPGDFFVPLTGEHTDGHQFIEMAAKNGAVGCFISETAEAVLPPGMCVISVPDTLSALQEAAGVYRQQFRLPVVGITGSVGKTTTKDLIAGVLSERFKTLKTEGNLNNQIGLPLMLTRISSDIQAAVLEMGMSGFGEIALLARLSLPSIGVITNIGESHLEMLGSREGIARAKSELLSFLPPDGTAVVNADEPLLKPYLQRLTCRVVTFGFSEDASVHCRMQTTDGARKCVCIKQQGFDPLWIEPPLPGKHNIYNLAAAVAVGRELNLTDREITAGLNRVHTSAMRLETVILPNRITVINDAYNASPTSMAAALDVLQEEAGTSGKIAVLGDMLELGAMEEEGHRRVGRLAAKSNLKALFVVGRRAGWIAAAAREAGMAEESVWQCETHTDAAEKIRKVVQKEDWILLKGSRSMRMEEVLYALQEDIQ